MTKSKPSRDPQPAAPPATRPDAGDPALQGEGNYTAARRHRKSVEKFVQSGQVEPAARRAAPSSDAQAREMIDAEAAGRARARR